MLINERFEQVAVVGAGPSLNTTKAWLKNYPCVIGVNNVFHLVKVDYLVITHFALLLDIATGKVKPDAMVVYSDRASDWMFQGAENPNVPGGIRFTEYRDLQCGTSTIIAAIDLACQLSDHVHLFGVDLRKSAGVQYAENYPHKKTQDEAFFNDWARVVGYQIDALRRHTNCEILRIG